MKVLTLDTSSSAVTAGVVSLDDGVRVLAEQATVNARAHAELLTPGLQAALLSAGMSLSDVDAVVVGAGPGPFTGLRAGLVTAASLSHALGIPAYPVCSLDAIALVAGAPVVVVTDARRREVYWARYDVSGNRVAGPSVSAPSDVDLDGVDRVAGQGVSLYADAFPVGVEPLYPTSEGLASAAADAVLAGAEPAALTPLYLRRPDAKEPTVRKQVS